MGIDVRHRTVAIDNTVDVIRSFEQMFRFVNLALKDQLADDGRADVMGIELFLGHDLQVEAAGFTQGEQLVVTARTIVPQMVVVADQQGVDMQLSDQIFQNEFLIGHTAEFEGEGHDDRVIYPEACKNLELLGKRGKQRDRSVANYGSRMRVERDDGTFAVSLAGQFGQSVEYGPVSVVDAVV